MITLKLEIGVVMKAFILGTMTVAVFAAGMGAAQTPAPTQTPSAADPNAVVSTGEDASFRMTVPVMINGKGPFQFVIDTGADRTVISSELAAKLGLPEGKKARLHSMGGTAMVNMVKIKTVQVATNTVRNMDAAALSFANLGADGLLGIDSLQGLRLTLDFRTKTMTAEPATAPITPSSEDNGGVIVVTARTRLGQLVMVDADANGEKIWVVVDTGAQNSIGNKTLRRTLIRNERVPTPKPITMVDVIGRETIADYTVVQSLRIGGVKMGNAAIAFSDAHPFRLFGLLRRPAMLLGMESLRSFQRVTIDFTTRKITFVLPSKG
jgi:predicted aspartyl protease